MARLKMPGTSVFCVLIATCLPLARAAYAESYQSSAVDRLPNEILAREIELQQLNQELNLFGANQSFNRTRRTWLWDFGNALPTEGGLIAATALFHSHSSDKIRQYIDIKSANGTLDIRPKFSVVHNHAPNSKVANTIIPQIAGQVIGGMGSYFELSADYRRVRRLNEHRLNARTLLRRVKELRDDIDDKLVRYSELIDKADDRQARLSEVKMLQQIRDKALFQYCSLEAATSQNTVGRLIEDTASAARNTIGTIGNTINVVAIMQNNKRLNGRGAILNLVAASMISARPFVSNTGSMLAKRSSKRRTKFLKLSDTEQLDAKSLHTQLDLLRNSAVPTDDSGANTGVRARLAIYQSQCDQFDEDDSLADRERQATKRQILRRYRESIYGPTKVAQATTGVVDGFRDLNNATVDNRLAAAGNLTYCSGQLFNILELTRERVIDEERHAKQKSAGLLPEQRIARSMGRLHAMHAMLPR